MNLNISVFDFEIPGGDDIEFEFGRIENMPGILKAETLPHRHTFYEILLITEGSGDQWIDFKKYNIEAPVVYFLSSEQVHFWEVKKPIKGFAFLFTVNFLLDEASYKPLFSFPFFHSATFHPVLPIRDREFLSGILTLVRQIGSEYAGRTLSREAILRSYLNILLSKFTDQFSMANKISLQASKSDGLLRMLKFKINDFYLTKKSPSEYASELNVTPKYLTQVVKKATQKTTSDLINERILLEAKRFLIYSESSISQIGYYLGFESPSYFGRFFRKFTKMSPGTFREKTAKVRIR